MIIDMCDINFYLIIKLVWYEIVFLLLSLKNVFRNNI